MSPPDPLDSSNSTSTPGYTPSLIRATHLDDESFVFNVTIFILACVALFAIFTWPRLFTRFSRGSEWTRGHFIYHSTKPRRRLPTVKRRPTVPGRSGPQYEKGRAPNSDDDHTTFSHVGLVRREANRNTTFSLPPHCRSWSGINQKASTILGIQVIDGYSLGQCIILICYSAIAIFASFYKSNPFKDYVRTGFVSTAQIPILFALATKNNIIGRFLSLGYEKLNYLHRFAGALAVLTANVHALGYIYEWSVQGIFTQKLQTSAAAYGFLALISVDILLLFSTALWRRNFYNVFLFTHITGMIFFPIGLVFHMPSTLPWVVLAAVIYGVDHLIRLFKTRICNATLRPIAELGLTRIEIPHLNAGWRPGQHVRLRILSTGVGMLGWAEIHPFTIASVSGDGLTLMVKKAGDWTNAVYSMATKSDAIYSGGWGGEKKAKVWIEGPYGGVGNTMMDSYSGAIFVVGGSGITFALSSITDLVQKDVQRLSRLKVIHLIWSVQDAPSLQPMIPTFAALLQQITYASLHISVHYTRASMFNLKKVYGNLPPQLTITAGRPKIASVIDTTIDNACKLFTPSGREHHASDQLSGVLIGVCGPQGLGEEVRKAVGAVEPRRFTNVGGIEVVEETFGW